MTNQTRTSFWRAAWKTVTEALNVWTLLQCFSAFGSSAIVAQLLPYEWNTAKPWLLTGLAFVSGILFARAIHYSFQWIQWKRDPPKLFFTEDSGQKATITLRNRGMPATFLADGRIVETLNGSPNPRTTRWECRLNHKGTDAASTARLGKDEWATIVVASIPINDLNGPVGLSIRVGQFGQEVIVPDNGVVIEMEIRSTPPMRMGAIIRRYEVVRDRHMHISVTFLDER